MNALKQISVECTVGTNSKDISEEELRKRVVEMELAFNTFNPDCRMHLFTNNIEEDILKSVGDENEAEG